MHESRAHNGSFAFFFASYISNGLTCLKREIKLDARQVLLLVDLSGDSVEIPAALRGETAASVGVLLDHLERLQSLESFAGDRTGTPDPVAGHRTVVSATWKTNRKVLKY